MRILMLGWEFPPFISGGLGTACYGLTRALDRMGMRVLFVLPKSVTADYATHVRLLSPDAPPIERTAHDNGPTISAGGFAEPVELPGSPGMRLPEFKHVFFKSIPTWLTSPYQTPAWVAERARATGMTVEQVAAEAMAALAVQQQRTAAGAAPQATDAPDYSVDLMEQIHTYADTAVRLTRGEAFDVIHAHDWMTYPAGLAIAAISGKPLVVHVHSTEFDRSGEHVDQRKYDIERRGMHGAMRVMCVSHLTRKIVEHRYGVPHEKVEVVYNGIDLTPEPSAARIRRGDRIVLFLGRITMQKGPEYFIAAAKKVLQKLDNVKFVIAGSGDKTSQIIEMAAQMGIGHKVLFAGFLRGRDVDAIFRMADVYVMPSVSEPFGIAPLEAISHDVPVIISKSSGVAEVLKHALKVDFWDVEEMANKIIAVLKHPPLSQTLRSQADLEVRKLTWEDAARKCVSVYSEVRAEMTHPPAIGRLTGEHSVVPEDRL